LPKVIFCCTGTAAYDALHIVAMKRGQKGGKSAFGSWDILDATLSWQYGRVGQGGRRHEIHFPIQGDLGAA